MNGICLSNDTSLEDPRELVCRAGDSGRPDRRSGILPLPESEILRQHEALLRFVARPYARFGVPLDDLLQEGRLALVLASRSFRPEAGARLWTYARKWVTGAMFHLVARQIAGPRCVGMDDVELVRARGSEALWDDSPETQLSLQEERRHAKDALAELSAREREVVLLKLEEECSFAEIALRLGISKPRAHQIFAQAMETLRVRIEASEPASREQHSFSSAPPVSER